MSWRYLPERAAEFWDQNFWDSRSSATSKSTHTVKKSSKRGSKMGISTTRQSGATLERLTGSLGVESWISSLRASRANPSPWRVNASEIGMIETSGPTPLELLGKWDRSSSSWKTSQVSLLTLTSDTFSGPWPRAGMVAGGTAYRLRPLAPITKGTGSGLWPTPKASPSGPDFARMFRPKSGGDDLVTAVAKKMIPTPTVNMITGGPNHASPSVLKAKHGLNLTGYVEKYPTPCRRDWRSGKSKDAPRDQLNERIGGILNPLWVEWLMGWPIGWTGLEPLEKDRFQQWLRSFGDC